MPPSDLEINRATYLLTQQHGDEATVRRSRRRAGLGGAAADTWQRLIVAIGTLGAPPTDAQH
jgi:hypothetical protein